MPLSVSSSRYQRKILDQISNTQKFWFEKSVNRSKRPLHRIQEKYLRINPMSVEQTQKFFNKMDDMLVKNFTEWIVPLLNERFVLIDEVPILINNQEFIVERLHSLYEDVWIPTYKGPVVNLAEIAKDGQSIHTKEVERITGSGITVLKEMNIPKGQKTLMEIEEAFNKYFDIELDSAKFPKGAAQMTQKLKRIMGDMKFWGAKKQVMGEDNLYRTILRGLWAKIKTFDPYIQEELVKRLYEEATESLEMCADGHVGRLVNVLVGFDEAFVPQISQMEYFQNNIAKIAESKAPMSFRIEQAKKLMDDIKMPQDEREAWLEAL
jgi:hypothetical protein